jgi:phage terminase Nu1 subunit (DNA packaging protein)
VLDRWVERGSPGIKAGKPGTRRYDVEALRRWQEERRDREKPTLDLAEERARLARVQRRFTAIKIRQLRGALIPREAVVLLDGQRQSSVRAAILRLPSDAVQRGVPQDCEGTLRDLVEGVLSSLAAMTWSDTQGAAEGGADG